MIWVALIGAGAAAAAIGRFRRNTKSDRMKGARWRAKRYEAYWDLRVKRQGLRRERP